MSKTGRREAVQTGRLERCRQRLAEKRYLDPESSDIAWLIARIDELRAAPPPEAADGRGEPDNVRYLRVEITSEIRTLPSGATFRRFRCGCGAAWDVPEGEKPTQREAEPEWHKPNCLRAGRDAPSQPSEPSEAGDRVTPPDFYTQINARLDRINARLDRLERQTRRVGAPEGEAPK